jgi:general secretion pathway protein E
MDPKFANLAGKGPDGVPALVDALISLARQKGASDLHLEPGRDSLEVRLRVDGALETLASLPVELSANVAARCKVLAGLLTYRIDIPQEGGMRDAAGEGRVSTFPVVHGEKVVIRFFQPGPDRDLDSLGFEPRIVEALKRALDGREGMILLTGPSGSGKTTTIYACLRRLASAGMQVCTLEDPVEREIPGITQSSIRPAAGFDFARGLRSLLRQDPEAIMIGEIRDPETAESALRAALTGHLVIATIHATSAPGAASRLLDMGLEPYLLTCSLKAILHQRLVRSADEKGRFPLAELLLPGGAFRKAVLARADADALFAAAKDDGMEPLIGAAKRAMEHGIITESGLDHALGKQGSS